MDDAAEIPAPWGVCKQPGIFCLAFGFSPRPHAAPQRVAGHCAIGHEAPETADAPHAPSPRSPSSRSRSCGLLKENDRTLVDWTCASGRVAGCEAQATQPRAAAMQPSAWKIAVSWKKRWRESLSE